ncbi:MAG: hydrogenase maturation protease [Bryobacteraceae bacterium]|jgi:hydrogenase maturation protease
MKPLLAIGLGNTLMGDDGVGCAVADRLAADPRLPDDVEVICGGTDLLRYAEAIEGRRRVVVVDAVQDGAEPGTVSVIGDADDRQEHAHYLSVGQAIKLLQMTTPARFTLLGVSVESVTVGEGLSPAVANCVDGIVERALEELRGD